MTPESGIPSATPDASGIANSSTSTVTDTSSAGAFSTPSSTADGATVENVQENQSAPTQETDPLAGVPTLEELQAAADKDTPYAKSLIQLRNALDPLKTKYSELENRFKVFEPVAEKFSAPEELQSLVEMRESLLGWEKDDQNRLIPSTQKFISQLDPQRAEFLFADLADGLSSNGEPRMDRALQFIATDPERRANAARILGLVEPSAVAPQWQATEEQLAVVTDDLKDTFKKLPYDTREKLALNDPEFINDYLKKEKFQNDLISEKEQRTQRDQYETQQREQMLQQEASRAGDTYVDNLLTTGLTTFHNSVVEQCNFIEPLDLAQLPQGMTPEQAGQMNAQIAEANKAEAAQITAQIVALINPQTRRYMLPTLKETGVVDDKMMELIDKAAEAVGNNGRNYGNLMHRGKLMANGNGYQPGADVVPLGNEAQRNFKLLVHYANQIKGKLMEKRSQFFAMKATGHNNLLGQQAVTRPGVQGSSYDPTTAAAPQPSGGKLTRAEMDRLYG